MHREQQAKTYAVDIETVSQGKRAIDYTDAQEYKLGNVKDPEKIKAKLEEKRSEARKKHALLWWLGKVVSIAFVDVYGNDPDVVFYGDSEAEILTKAYEYLKRSGQKADRNFSTWEAFYLRTRWRHELADGVEHDPELRVAILLQFLEPFGQFLIGLEQLAQAHEGPDHQQAHRDGLRRIEHRRGHQGSVFREHEWRVFSMLSASCG